MKKSSLLSELEKKNLAADKRLQRTYGITLADYDRMLKEQNGGCWICGKPPKENKRLHVDHDHIAHKTKITVTKGVLKDYTAWAEGGIWGLITAFYPNNKTRKDARERAKRDARRKSVRALLCWFCNTGLQKWRDNPDLMEKAAKYIRKHKQF